MTTMELIATIAFALAVVHTFSVSYFQHLASKHEEGSVLENLFHLLGEVEVVFGLWSGIFILLMAFNGGLNSAIAYTESLNFTEPMFVFTIMTVAATKPIVSAAKKTILLLAKLIPISASMSIYIVCLTLGCLLGSFITEPAAMTLVALILLDEFYEKDVSAKFKYVTLAVLFVNISIGGVLTPFAAPPVLMVASKWNWDLTFMLTHFGWKAALAVTINAITAAFVLRKEFLAMDKNATTRIAEKSTPFWLTGIHFIFLFMIVFTSHHPAFFVPLFLFFIGVVTVTEEYQEELKIKQSLLVAFFLGGLIVLGTSQTWWLQPLLSRLDSLSLFLGATALTAITDNAALTFLGSQVENLSEFSKYALVSGAVVGGGLSVIANAPNPAGYSILQKAFGTDGISALKLLFYALYPTLVAMACFWLL